jgi:hypothetical protein
MPTPSLSFDVLFIIFGFLADNADLRICSMVHSTWTPPSQARLFHSVVVRLGQWRRLLVILHASPHLRSLVHGLDIHAWAPHGEYVSHEQIALLFPRVERMKLRNVQQQDSLEFLSAFPALKHLALLSSDVDFPTDVIDCVALESLDICRMCYIDNHMTLRGALDFIASSATTRTLRVLRIHVPQPGDYPLLRTTLNALTSLEELEMTVPTQSLAQIGALLARRVHFFALTGREAGFNLGKIRVKVLKLIVHEIDAPTVEGVFLLLKHTSFPRMIRLRLTFRESAHRRRLDRSPRDTFYHPFGKDWNGDSRPDWELTPVLAKRLKRVHVELYRTIPCLFQAKAFFRLFGPANDPRILKFVPNQAQVVD